MKNILKSFILAVAVCLLASVAACNGKDFTIETLPEATGKINETFSVVLPEAKDSDGNKLTVTVKSVKSPSGKVMTEIPNNEFVLEEAGEYVITFSAVYEETEKTSQQKVVCVDDRSPTIGEKEDVTANIGTEFTIELPEAKDHTGKTVQAQVMSVKDPDGQDVAISDTIKLLKEGQYVIVFAVTSNGKTVTSEQVITVVAEPEIIINDLSTRMIATGSVFTIYKDQFEYANGATAENTSIEICDKSGNVVNLQESGDSYSFEVKAAGQYKITLTTTIDADYENTYYVYAAEMTNLFDFEENELNPQYVKTAGFDANPEMNMVLSLNDNAQNVAAGKKSLAVSVPANIPSGNWPAIVFADLPKVVLSGYNYFAVDIKPVGDVGELKMNFKIYMNGTSLSGEAEFVLSVNKWNTVKLPLEFLAVNSGNTIDLSKDKLEKFEIYFNTGNAPAQDVTLYIDNFSFVEKQYDDAFVLEEDFEHIARGQSLKTFNMENVQYNVCAAPENFTAARGNVLDVDYTAVQSGNGGRVGFIPYTNSDNGANMRAFTMTSTSKFNKLVVDVYNPNNVKVQATFVIFTKDGGTINAPNDRSVVIEANSCGEVFLELTEAEMNKDIYDVRLEFWFMADPVDYSGAHIYLDNLRYGIVANNV